MCAAQHAIGLACLAVSLTPGLSDAQAVPLDSMASDIATKLAAACPPAGRADVDAYRKCRAALQHESFIPWAQGILWGGDQSQLKMAKKQLTHFAPQVFQDMYLPLLWFTGKSSVAHDDVTNLDVIRVQAYFRNALPSGSFPYPFWHSADKWNAWETLNEVRLYVNTSGRIVAATRDSAGSDDARGPYASVKPPAFDGHWQWTDASGKLQPHASLFSDNFNPANPVLPALDAAYRDFALNIREGTCLGCHTPDNRSQMDHLVLLQTPMHAAGEIDNVLKMVGQGDMPRDDIGDRKEIDPNLRAAILTTGEKFRTTLAEAKKWEADHPQR
jgi:hypothetical protein